MMVFINPDLTLNIYIYISLSIHKCIYIYIMMFHNGS